ncbi:RraA family protein [Brevundimonas sp. S30B]|uniref:RraA family protein n=1 Tax=unclassified Brevundimonas TaxID=2622653 RepID=UPI001071777A|nr:MULTISPECIES: RraA family protein [unclassified Brevundimonas]QBX36680.1 RraA family protein [Brevundimonas sp. MF30-B]TFW04525.1 RraA family protein [Brevundimonas sp. S30B]
MTQTPAQRLARLDACAVSDALDQLGLEPSITGLRPLSVRQRISGRVTTVRLAAGKPAQGAPPRHLCTTAIDASEPGAVVVVEQRTGVECAGWGGILSNAARGRDLAGVIVEGLARDVDEAADIGFPVYGRGSTARTARGRIHEAETGGPITVGDVLVRDGDWVVADSSGCAFVPADALDAVLEAAEHIAAKEAAMTKAVLGGEPVSTVMGARYEHLLEKSGQ